MWLTTNPLNTKIANFVAEELPLDEKTSAQELELSGSWEQSWQWLLDSQTTPRKEANNGLARILYIVQALLLLKTTSNFHGILEIPLEKVVIAC